MEGVGWGHGTTGKWKDLPVPCKRLDCIDCGIYLQALVIRGVAGAWRTSRVIIGDDKIVLKWLHTLFRKFMQGW